MNNEYNVDIKTDRKLWLDIARGIGILLIILGHSTTTVVRNNSDFAMFVYNYLYFFHVRLLFFLSGYAFGLKEEKYLMMNTRSFIFNKMKRLIIPYVSYSFLVLIIFSVANSFESVAQILGNMEYSITTFGKWMEGLLIGKNNYSVHLWYIYTLFFITILVFFLKKYIVSNKVVTLLFLLLFIMDAAIGEGGIFGIRTICQFGIFFILGKQIQVSRTFYKNKSIKIYMIISHIYLLFYAYYKTQNIDMRFIGDEVVYLFFSLGIILSIIYISMYLKGSISRILLYFGAKSFGVYIFHQPFFGSGIGMVLYGVFKMPILFTIGLSIILSICIPLLIILLLNKRPFSKIKFLFLG